MTICGQEHEMQILQQLSEHFNNLSKKNKIDADLDVESDFSIGNVSAVLSDDPENETEQERKIRLGEMTPFGTVLQANQIRYNGFTKINSNEFRISIILMF